mmetsp:Transcript_18220/g.34565  ORF Transcript_18220/g.34565 Transcript_18220/m.34565 type:complete len:356 (-) Transcript_18220:75-1142(-)|eukprot:scaffold2227_cov168-Amphora_coffeaeformis.AAC.4
MGWFGKKDRTNTSQQHSLSDRTPTGSEGRTATVNSIATTSYVPPPQPPKPKQPLPVVTRQQSSEEQEEAVMVDRNIDPDNLSGVEAGKSYSGEYDHYEEDHTEAVRQNHLNSLFNGHLMKWKFEAEEGSPFIRIPAFLGALALIVATVIALVMEPESWTAHSIVMSVCILFMSMFVLILDGRFLASNPLSARAHLRNIMTRNFNIFRFLWGRGLLYIAAGILSVAQMWPVNLYAGIYVICVGVVALSVGVHASRKFAALRNSLADESFLLLVFSNYDTDGDGYVSPSEFAILLADLGMELDDRYTLKAFNVIDTDNDRRVSFEEFSHWWASGYIERGRRRRDDDTEEDDSYRRMG